MGERLNRRAEGGSTGASNADNRKQSLYFPEGMLQELKEEAARLDRSLSWVVQRAWKMAKADIRQIPSVNDVGGEDATNDGTESDEG